MAGLENPLGTTAAGTLNRGDVDFQGTHSLLLFVESAAICIAVVTLLMYMSSYHQVVS